MPREDKMRCIGYNDACVGRAGVLVLIVVTSAVVLEDWLSLDVLDVTTVTSSARGKLGEEVDVVSAPSEGRVIGAPSEV